MRPRSGVALLEVVVALAILVTAGISLMSLTRLSLIAVGESAARERETEAAADFMTRVALWSRADLDRHLGQRPQGDWSLEIERVTPSVYVIVLRDSTDRSLLQTSFYRRESFGAADAR